MESGAWSDALSRADLIGLAQVVLTTLGFVFTVWQLLRTVRETKATNRLLSSLRDRLLWNDLLLVLPQMQRLEDELDAALKAGNQPVLEIRLADYVRSGSETAALLHSGEDRMSGAAALATSLGSAVDAASKLRSQLMKGTENDLPRAARPLMRLVVPLTADISRFIGALRRTTGMEGDTE